MSASAHQRNPSRLAIKSNSNFIHYKLPTYKTPASLRVATRRNANLKFHSTLLPIHDCRHVRVCLCQQTGKKEEEGVWTFGNAEIEAEKDQNPGGSYGLHCSCRQETQGLFLISGVLLKLWMLRSALPNYARFGEQKRCWRCNARDLRIMLYYPARLLRTFFNSFCVAFRSYLLAMRCIKIIILRR